MSGGVDSSVAACLMKEQSYDCIGATMKLFHNEDIGQSRKHTCCSLEDVEDARSVAYKLQIPYYVFNFSEQFKEYVIEPFISAYKNGSTPNPCIACNRHLKFEKLFWRAKELGCDVVTTGHYARIAYDSGSDLYQLKKALDPAKDQSYVLYAMTQEQLKHTLFPLGELTKSEVRKLAEKHGFSNAHKHDSQDICFVPNGNYAEFIEQYTGCPCPHGQFIDNQSTPLGTHRGIIRYTVGQHRKLGLNTSEAMYVCRICPESNTVVLGTKAELHSRGAAVASFNWIAGKPPSAPVRCSAKIRYRQQEQRATAIPLDHDRVQLIFDEPQRAITPGQAAVLYDGDVVLGGGTISR